MVINYENLLVIAVEIDLNLKKFGVGWFERILEIKFCEICEMEEMSCCLSYINVTVVNSCWVPAQVFMVSINRELTSTEVI